MKVFVTREIPEEIKKMLFDEGIEITEWKEKRKLKTAELIELCKACDGLLCISQRLNEDFFKHCTHLKVVATCSVGFDHIDVNMATKMKIPVGNTPGVLSKATADTAFLLMQNVARKAFFWHKEILNDHWDFFEPLKNVGFDLQGKTLGIFGLGRIGFEMAKSAKGAFDMPVIYHNRNRNIAAEKKLGAVYVSFDDLLKQSDVLSVHANLNAENKGIFNKEAFNKMKNTAVFINSARGGLHNEEDLKAALENNQIGGAGLDVTNPEPMSADNPLLSMANTAILPHIGSATVETRMAMLKLSAQHIIAGLKGEKLAHCVNPEVYN